MLKSPAASPYFDEASTIPATTFIKLPEIKAKPRDIVIEDLKVSKYVEIGKGTAEQHGRNVKAKSGLNRSIPIRAGRKCAASLSTNSSWRGGQVLAVPLHGHKLSVARAVVIPRKKMCLSQSKFVCVGMRYTANADVNGARKYFSGGTPFLPVEDDAVRPPV